QIFGMSDRTEIALAPQGLALPLPAGGRYRVRIGTVVPADSPVSISFRTRDRNGTREPIWRGPAQQLAHRSFDFDSPGDDPALLLVEPEASSPSPLPRLDVELFARKLPWPRLSASPAQRPNIFVYLIDTLRADAIGPHSARPSLTPRIDEFEKDAVAYEKTWSSSSWTVPATISLLSGVYPFEHGVQQMGLPVPAHGIPWLPDELKNMGYETELISQWLVGEVEGIERGFDHYFLDVRLGADSYEKSDSSVARGLFWQQMFYRTDPRRPMFAFIHVVDPHAPYEPPREDRIFAQRQPGTLPETFYAPQVFLATGFGRNGADRAQLRALYDGEVRHADREFGAFLDLLRYRGLYANSLIVLVSDHGEEFYEHEGFDHGRTLYEEVLRVPLIVKYPRQRGAGQRVGSPVSTIDVMPTVLRTVERPFGDLRLHGGVLPEPGTNSANDRPLFAEVQVGRSGGEGPIFISAMIDHGVKCLRNGLGRDRFDRPAPETQAFDLTFDPAELAPLALDSRKITPCLSALSTWVSRAREASQRPDRPTPSLSPEEIRRLRSLGYLR